MQPDRYERPSFAGRDGQYADQRAEIDREACDG